MSINNGGMAMAKSLSKHLGGYLRGDEKLLLSLAEVCDPEHTALLVVDMQNDFVHGRGRSTPKKGEPLAPPQRIVPDLRAFVDVQLGDWKIFEWRIIKKDGQRAWVSVPMASWKDLDHKVRYRALLSIPDELKQRIEVAILSAWEKEKRSEETKQ